MPPEKIAYKVVRVYDDGSRVSAIPLPRGYQRTYVDPRGDRLTVPTSIAFSDAGPALMWARAGEGRPMEVWRCSCVESEPLVVAFGLDVLIEHDDIGPDEMFAILSGRAVLIRRTVYAKRVGDIVVPDYSGFHADQRRWAHPPHSVVCRDLRPIHQVFSGKMTHPC